MPRVGFGYDVHRFVTGRDFVLGGVKIPHEQGLLGHSDADVLVHSVMDALLGATADGDIGQHFPKTDPQYENISSLELLARVRKRVEEKGYCIVNVDSVIVLEEPKIGHQLGIMQENIASTLQIDLENVNVKACTSEGLGFTGRSEGVVAYAVALVERQGSKS